MRSEAPVVARQGEGQDGWLEIIWRPQEMTNAVTKESSSRRPDKIYATVNNPRSDGDAAAIERRYVCNMRTKERGAIDEDAKSRQKSPKVVNEQMLRSKASMGDGLMAKC